jgi:NADH-quinone oxidoreductase subunit N
MTETVEIPVLLPALPEIVLAIGAMVLLMVGAFRGEQTAKGIEGAAILLLVLTGLIVVLLPAGKLVTFGGSFIVDGFARFLKLLALAGSAAAILMSSNYLALEKRETFEYSILILLSTAGMMMLISAADLIALYLGLELMSLALYVVAAINRDSVRSTEAGLKYFVLGALSSGMLLYGASLVYGFTGTVSFAGIANAASQGSAGTASLGLVSRFLVRWRRSLSVRGGVTTFRPSCSASSSWRRSRVSKRSPKCVPRSRSTTRRPSVSPKR